MKWQNKVKIARFGCYKGSPQTNPKLLNEVKNFINAHKPTFRYVKQDNEIKNFHMFWLQIFDRIYSTVP